MKLSGSSMFEMVTCRLVSSLTRLGSCVTRAGIAGHNGKN